MVCPRVQCLAPLCRARSLSSREMTTATQHSQRDTRPVPGTAWFAHPLENGAHKDANIPYATIYLRNAREGTTPLDARSLLLGAAACEGPGLSPAQRMAAGLTAFSVQPNRSPCGRPWRCSSLERPCCVPLRGPCRRPELLWPAWWSAQTLHMVCKSTTQHCTYEV